LPASLLVLFALLAPFLASKASAAASSHLWTDTGGEVSAYICCLLAVVAIVAAIFLHLSNKRKRGSDATGSSEA
jgi:hypothetical protein